MGHLWVAKAHDQDSARFVMAVVRGLGHGGRARCVGEASTSARVGQQSNGGNYASCTGGVGHARWSCDGMGHVWVA